MKKVNAQNLKKWFGEDTIEDVLKYLPDILNGIASGETDIKSIIESLKEINDSNYNENNEYVNDNCEIESQTIDNLIFLINNGEFFKYV